jgi:hypothetical protein
VAGLALALCALHTSGQPRPISHAQQRANGARFLVWSASKLKVRELTGRNDGVEVEAFLKVTGNRKGDAWCGAFQAAGQKACALPFPAGAGGSYNWFKDKGRTYYVRNLRGSIDSVQPTHKVGFYYANLGRIGHIGLVVAAGRAVRKGRPARGFTIRAGNTGTGGGRDGAGVHDIFYASTDLYAVSNWNY